MCNQSDDDDLDYLEPPDEEVGGLGTRNGSGGLGNGVHGGESHGPRVCSHVICVESTTQRMYRDLVSNIFLVVLTLMYLHSRRLKLSLNSGLASCSMEAVLVLCGIRRESCEVKSCC